MKNQLSETSTRPGSSESNRNDLSENQYQQRFARAFRLGKLGWWEWMHGEHIEASDELYDMFGLNKTAHRFSTGMYLSLVHPDDLSSVMENISHLWQAAHHQYEHRVVKPGGEIIEVSITIEAIRDNENNLKQLHGIVQNISENKKGEKEAKEAQRRLASIVESVGDGFIALDRNWTVVYWNKKMEQVTGKLREEALGRDLWKLYPNARSLKYFNKFRQALAENQPVHFEEFSPKYKLWLDVSAYPSQDGLSVYIKDITERKQWEDDRKKVDARLQQTKENLVSTLQNMSDGFCTLDRNWTFTYLNDRLLKMIGGTHQDEFLGKNLWHCFPQAVSSKFFTGYHKAMAENTFVSIEDYYPELDIWLEVNVHPDDNGLSFFLRDITERKLYEKRLEFIAKATAGVIWEQELATGKVVMNGEKCKLLSGYEIKDNSFPRSFWLEKIHPDDLPAIEENLAYAIQHNLDFHINEYRFKKADGHWVYLKSRIYLMKDENGKSVSLVGTIDDVTGKRLSEMALVENEMSYRQLFNNSPLPTVIADVHSMRILDVNTATIEQYGYSRAELLALTIPHFHPGDQHEKLMAEKDNVQSGMRNNLGAIYHVKKNGERILVEVSVTTIHYKGHDAFLATAKDVTEKVRMEQELVEQKINHQKNITKAVMDAQETERTEIGKELHDNVNQILATAKLYLENSKHYPDQKDLFVHKSIALLNQSIQETRRLSHVLVTPTITNMGFKETLQELIETYSGLKTFRINYLFNFDEAEIDKGIKLTIYRILQEQFHNTMKHAGASVVQIEIKNVRNSLHLTYEDNGVGFNPVTAKRGIGLKNIANRVSAYNGKVKLKSSVGKGYKMRILFPM